MPHIPDAQAGVKANVSISLIILKWGYNNPLPDLGSQHIVQLICRQTKSNKTNEACLWMRFLKVSYCWIASVSSLSDNDKMIYSETHSRPHDFISFVQHKKRSLGECSCCSFQYSYSEGGLKVRSHLLLLGENVICTIWRFVWIWRSSSWLHKFTVYTNRKMHGLCKMCFMQLYAIDRRQYGPFCLQTFAEILLLLHLQLLKWSIWLYYKLCKTIHSWIYFPKIGF